MAIYNNKTKEQKHIGLILHVEKTFFFQAI